MHRLFASYFDGLEPAYRDRPHFVGLKAKLLAICSLLIVVLVPVNTVKLLWMQPPMIGYRLVFAGCMFGAALVSLRWLRQGQVERAGNGLVLVATLSIHGLLLLVPAYPQPLRRGA